MHVFAVFAVALILLCEQNLDEAVVSNDGSLYGPILNVQRPRTRPCTPQPGLDRYAKNARLLFCVCVCI
jgi:hypothetical protein